MSHVRFIHVTLSKTYLTQREYSIWNANSEAVDSAPTCTPASTNLNITINLRYPPEEGFAWVINPPSVREGFFSSHYLAKVLCDVATLATVALCTVYTS